MRYKGVGLYGYIRVVSNEQVSHLAIYCKGTVSVSQTIDQLYCGVKGKRPLDRSGGCGERFSPGLDSRAEASHKFDLNGSAKQALGSI